MTRFIELHFYGRPMMLAVGHISVIRTESIKDLVDPTKIVGYNTIIDVIGTNDREYGVDESYAEVKAMLEREND